LLTQVRNPNRAFRPARAPSTGSPAIDPSAIAAGAGSCPTRLLRSGEVVQLQRWAGNAAVARLLEKRPAEAGPSPRRQPPAAKSPPVRTGRTLQRLIAVNPAGTPHTDYAIMKQVQQLRKVHSKPVVILNSTVDFSEMDAGEQLFIVSHGNAVDGDLRDLPTQTLIDRLNHAHRGVPANIGGITLLSCYSGRPVQAQSLAERVAGGLNHHNIPVQGAVGFSFGSPEFGQTAHSSVMAEDLRAIYSADNIDDMANAWRNRQPTHNGGILTELPGLDIFAVSTNRTTYQILRDKQLSDGEANDRIRTLMGKLKSEIKRIEAGLRGLLGQLPGMNVAEKVQSFEEPWRHGKKINKWDRLIEQQYELFHKYYLWTPDDGGAFASFDS
jgi:hypothetical protein